VIRNVVIHILNEQPLLADLFGPPTANDAGLLCTNLRTPDGRRPVFIDHSAGIFYFPYLHIRFLEIPREALDLLSLASGQGNGQGSGQGDGPAQTAGTAAWADAVPIAVAPSRSRPEDGLGDLGLDAESDLEIDEDVLRKIREI
jgi:hypothetical protein